MHTTRKFLSVAVKCGLMTLIDKKRVQEQIRSVRSEPIFKTTLWKILYSGTRQPKKQDSRGLFPQNPDFQEMKANLTKETGWRWNLILFKIDQFS